MGEDAEGAGEDQQGQRGVDALPDDPQHAGSPAHRIEEHRGEDEELRPAPQAQRAQRPDEEPARECIEQVLTREERHPQAVERGDPERIHRPFHQRGCVVRPEPFSVEEVARQRHIERVVDSGGCEGAAQLLPDEQQLEDHQEHHQSGRSQGPEATGS